MTTASAPETSLKKTEQKPRIRIGRIFFVLAIALLAVGAALFFWWMRQPGEGTVAIREGVLRDPKAAPATRLDRFEGKYASFQHPGDFVVRNHVTDTGPVELESIFLTENALEGRKIALTIRKYEGMELADIPSIRLRDLEKTSYQKEKIVIASYEGLLYLKNSQIFETTFFFERPGKRFVSVSTTSPVKMEGLREGLEAVVQSLEFSDE